MADMNLNEPRAYFHDLAGPAFDEFWDEYQADTPFSERHFSVVYRRLIAACVLLNHTYDKVSADLGCGKNGRPELLHLIHQHDQIICKALNACRHHSNDLKHIAKKNHSVSLRARNSGYDVPGDNPVFSFTLSYPEPDGKFDMCLVVGEVFNFWRAYFSKEFSL